MIPGSNVVYECLPGTVPEISQDDLKVTCLDSGQWSSKIPVKCVWDKLELRELLNLILF